MVKTSLGQIADIITGPFGSALHQYEYVEDGVPVIMPQDIESRGLNYEKIAHITAEKANDLSRYIVVKNDIVYARRGDVEKHAFITDADDGAICGTGCLRVRLTDEKINPLYLSYYLDRPETRKWIVAHAVGSNMLNLNTDILGRVPVVLPDKPYQDRVVKVLNSLESRINSNKGICSTLESVAKLLYNYWFTQYDFPDENGNPYKSSGGDLIYDNSLKRKIPKGWKSARMSSIISTKKRGDWGSDVREAESDLHVACIRGADMGSLRHGPTASSTERFIPFSHKNRILEYGDCVIEISGTPGRSTYINNNLMLQFDYPLISSNFCQIVTPIKRNMLYWFINLWDDLCQAGAADYYSSQTTMKNLQFDIMASSIRIAVPNDELLEKYHNKTSIIYENIQSLYDENRQLIAIRDWLLPMLMNGQAIIKEN